MQVSSLQHTMFLFETLVRHTPPLVPKKIASDMQAALEQLHHNYRLTAEEAEAMLIAFGKKVWPYRQAFAEFCETSTGELGEVFFMSHLDIALKKRYQEFLVYGGTFRDMYTGKPAPFFTADERVYITKALVTVTQEIRTHARQAVMSTLRTAYMDRVEEFRMILGDIEVRLAALGRMADEEQEHPELASEIRSQIVAFEEGLCLLGQHTSHQAVQLSAEHFVGRKKERLARRHGTTHDVRHLV